MSATSMTFGTFTPSRVQHSQAGLPTFVRRATNSRPTRAKPAGTRPSISSATGTHVPVPASVFLVARSTFGARTRRRACARIRSSVQRYGVSSGSVLLIGRRLAAPAPDSGARSLPQALEDLADRRVGLLDALFPLLPIVRAISGSFAMAKWSPGLSRSIPAVKTTAFSAYWASPSAFSDRPAGSPHPNSRRLTIEVRRPRPNRLNSTERSPEFPGRFSLRDLCGPPRS